MDHNKKQNIILVLCAIIIIALFIQNRATIQRLENLEGKVSSMMNNMAMEYSNLYNSISSIKSEFQKSFHDITSYVISYEDLDYQKGIVTTKVTFNLKEIEPQSEYYVAYSPLDKEDFQEIKARNNTSNSFEGHIPLSLNHNYQFKIIQKSADGGRKELSEDDLYVHSYNDLNANRTFIYGSSKSEGGNNLILGYSISNKTYGFMENQIKKVELSLYYSNVLVYQKDITENTVPITLEGEIVSTGYTTVESNSVDDLSNITSDITYHQYYVSIDKSKLKEEFKELLKSTDNLMNSLIEKITITFQNGARIEL